VANHPTRVSIEGVHNPTGVQFVTVLHYNESDPPIEGTADRAAVAENVWNHIDTAYANVLRADCTVQMITGREELPRSSTDIPESGSFPVDVDGTLSVAADDLPIWYTAKLVKRTAAAIRSGHGWILMPLTADGTTLSGGLIPTTSGYWTDLQSFGDALEETVTWGTLPSHSVEPVVYSGRRHNRGEEPFMFQITAVDPRRQPSMLRSRLPA
jgi:hypothetical protein